MMGVLNSKPKLLHYCTTRFILDVNESYYKKKPNFFKPRGLYLSVDDAWIQWMRSQEFYLKLYQWVYEFEFKSFANILIIQTFKELMDFVKKYPDTSNGKGMIDWDCVEKEYDGIGFKNYKEIKNMCFSFVNVPMWYYGLDVNCYVIWNCEILEEKSCEAFNFLDDVTKK